MNKPSPPWHKTRQRVRWFVGLHVAAVCLIYVASLWVSDHWLTQREAEDRSSNSALVPATARVHQDVQPTPLIPATSSTPPSATDRLGHSNDLPAPWTEDANGQVRWIQP